MSASSPSAAATAPAPEVDPAGLKPATTDDFEKFKALALAATNDTDGGGWIKKYEDSAARVTVWVKQTSQSAVKMGRIAVWLPENPEVVYDVLHDPEYRTVWDKYMVEGYDIRRIGGVNDDVGYYRMKFGFGLSDRDFVNQRSWRVLPNEWIIMNHSVTLPDYPKRSGCERGWSYLTGYMVTPCAPGGSNLLYLTQADLRGWIPTWIINQAISISAAAFAQTFKTASSGYTEWKNKHDPTKKPWL
ncbi:phosphatidylcholine transfer protein [Pelomyxa schiedti]|nr:phosphatidylcholine transfer protein [Pelomyxa schiedti]